MQPLLRTGYEYLMPYKVGNLYASVAEQDGIVTQKTNKLLTIKYADGTIKGIPLGERYGRMEGSVYPHSIISDLIVGNKFKQNDYLSYNTAFFEHDWLDPSKLIFKFGDCVKVALTMTNEVFEDSSSISEELSKRSATELIKEKTFVIEFDKNIINLIPEGSKVEPNDILFTLSEESVDYTNLSDNTVNMLQNLAAMSPKAKVNGIIDRYEIRYNGEVQDMSPTLRKLTNRLNTELYESTKGTEEEVLTGKVNSEYRVEGKNLNIDTLELRVYIRIKVNNSIGDKNVYCNQMKSVTSSVMTEKVMTESGEEVDAMFSFNGILNRQVLSPILIGVTNRLLKHVSGQIADVYFNE